MTENLGQNVVALLHSRYAREVGSTAAELEIETGRMIERLGLREKAGKLSETNRQIVAEGIADLWIVKTIGRRTEEADRERVGGAILQDKPGNPNMQRIVEKELGEVDHLNGWFDNSVISVVSAALAPDDQARRRFIDSAMSGPDRYVRAMDAAGQNYGKFKTELSWAAEGGSEALVYLEGERPANIRAMKGILHHGLGRDLAGLRSTTV